MRTRRSSRFQRQAQSFAAASPGSSPSASTITSRTSRAGREREGPRSKAPPMPDARTHGGKAGLDVDLNFYTAFRNINDPTRHNLGVRAGQKQARLDGYIPAGISSAVVHGSLPRPDPQDKTEFAFSTVIYARKYNAKRLPYNPYGTAPPDAAAILLKGSLHRRVSQDAARRRPVAPLLPERSADLPQKPGANWPR